MLDVAVLKHLWPHAATSVVADTAGQSSIVFPKFNLSTPLRVAHFLAQISHESDGGTITEENLNYTTPARIAAVWPSRFSVESAQAYTHNPQKLADKVYNGRMGNRVGTDDGWNFRGRGFLQITGRDSYDRIGRQLGLDLVNNPSLVNAYDQRLKIAVAEFVNLGCLPFCDADDIVNITHHVNGGLIGLPDRRAWFAKWKLALSI